MPYITNPDAPERDQAVVAAEEMAARLRNTYQDYHVRIVECLPSRFEVRIEVPFRDEQLTWEERQEAAAADPR